MSQVTWLRARLLAHEAHLLSEAEEERFRRLVESDEDCRRLYEEFVLTGPEETGSPDHISAYRLARWPKISSELRGLDREIVRKHLESCPDCRSDLEALGFEPVLPGVAEPEASPSGPALRRPERPVEKRGTGWLGAMRAILGRPTPWAVGWAATAVALAATFSGNRGGSPSLTVALPGAAMNLRGSDDRNAAVTSADGRSLAVIVSPPAAVDLDSRVDVEIVGPTGNVIARLGDQVAGDVVSPRYMFLTTDKRLAEGVYRVRFLPSGSTPAVGEVEFAVRSAP